MLLVKQCINHCEDTLEVLEDVKNGRYIDAKEVYKWLDSQGTVHEPTLPAI